MNVIELGKPKSARTLAGELVSSLAEISSLITEKELMRNPKVRERIKVLRSLVIELYSQELPSIDDPTILKQLKPILGEF
jgi:hypothetical protein